MPGGTPRTAIGRPPAIGRVIATADDGTDLTVADVIIDAITNGALPETAVAAANIDRDTFHRWLRTGARVRAALNNDTPRGDFTRNELAYAAFHERLMSAWATRTDIEWAAVGQAALGGHTLRNTITKIRPATPAEIDAGQADDRGRFVETTIRVEEQAPDWRAAAWRLAVRHPDTFSQRRIESGLANPQHVPELPVDTGDDEDAEIEAVVEAIERWKAARAGDVIDVEVIDDGGDDG